MSEKLSDLVPSSRFAAMKELNPERIYLENVRAIFGTPLWIARFVCETAVRRGFFKKKIQFLCPDGAVAMTLEADQVIPPQVPCWQEQDGDFERVFVDPRTLDRLEFYALAEAQLNG